MQNKDSALLHLVLISRLYLPTFLFFSDFTTEILFVFFTFPLFHIYLSLFHIYVSLFHIYVYPYFIFMYMHNNHFHRATAHLQLNILLLLLLLLLYFRVVIRYTQHMNSPHPRSLARIIVSVLYILKYILTLIIKTSYSVFGNRFCCSLLYILRKTPAWRWLK